MRVEVTLVYPVYLCKIYAQDGSTAGVGRGLTEIDARVEAALDLGGAVPATDPTPDRRKRVVRSGASPLRRSTRIEHAPRSASKARFELWRRRLEG